MSLTVEQMINDVRAWHIAFGLNAPTTSVRLDHLAMERRRRICGEEAGECMTAIWEASLRKRLDGLIDLSWTVAGTAVEMGMGMGVINITNAEMMSLDRMGFEHANAMMHNDQSGVIECLVHCLERLRFEFHDYKDRAWQAVKAANWAKGWHKDQMAYAHKMDWAYKEMPNKPGYFAVVDATGKLQKPRTILGELDWQEPDYSFLPMDMC